MNATRRHGSDSGTRGTNDAAIRGALLIGVAVIIGMLLLWRGHDDGDAVATTPGDTSQPDTTDPSGTAAPGSETTVPGSETTVSVPVTHPKAEVGVLVANGTGTSGGAGIVTNKLIPLGWGTKPPADASTSDVVASRVYYREGYADDARQVARDLGVPEPVDSIIEPMPEPPPVKGNTGTASAQLAQVLVLLGSDQVIKQS